MYLNWYCFNYQYVRHTFNITTVINTSVHFLPHKILMRGTFSNEWCSTSLSKKCCNIYTYNGPITSVHLKNKFWKEFMTLIYLWMFQARMYLSWKNLRTTHFVQSWYSQVSYCSISRKFMNLIQSYDRKSKHMAIIMIYCKGVLPYRIQKAVSKIYPVVFRNNNCL